jgi:TetR/AcrR family transcriptional regulator, transcriptional repressor of aconitase
MPRVSDEHLAARRRQILDAALIRFARDGFHQTPMQAIFEEAGLSPGAVYRYFKSKEEIVQAIAAETLGGFQDAMQAGPPGEPLGPVELLERLFDAIASVGMRAERLRVAVQIWSEALRNPDVRAGILALVGRLLEQLTDDLRDAQRRGVLDPDLDPHAVARVLLAVGQGFVVQSTWYEDLDAQAFRAAARGLLEGGA